LAKKQRNSKGRRRREKDPHAEYHFVSHLQNLYTALCELIGGDRGIGNETKTAENFMVCGNEISGGVN